MVDECARLLRVTLPPGVQLDVPPPTKLPPTKVQACLRADQRELAKNITSIENDLATFQDVRALKAFLRQLEAQHEDIPY